MVRHTLLWPSWLLLLARSVQANTEKTIFKAPPVINMPTQPPTLDSLGLDILTPDVSSLRTRVQANFPDEASPGGPATWLLLYNLTASQRYEMRVCWAATQPTSFTLDTYELDEVFETPELITSLAVYSQIRHLTPDGVAGKATPPIQLDRHGHGDIQASVLFLRILAKADYFSDDEARMSLVEPVNVDLILDPYVLNVLPRSLAPTAAYITAVAALAVFLSQYVRSRIHGPSVVPVAKKSQ
ncbi:hypothetical protein B0T11DRAFT_343981 [Plectosphaerella cucumerina]|uniref:Uncharacterized protein n=1 Tax=Plectosphaerella cucumerina TaxID=40658 RepID=A0A8K0X037_9PEZI|nr:hypothetical protein B0T11DRAFT_343981 [Plectosphaerella cucumerina]